MRHWFENVRTQWLAQPRGKSTLAAPKPEASQGDPTRRDLRCEERAVYAPNNCVQCLPLRPNP